MNSFDAVNQPGRFRRRVCDDTIWLFHDPSWTTIFGCASQVPPARRLVIYANVANLPRQPGSDFFNRDRVIRRLTVHGTGDDYADAGRLARKMFDGEPGKSFRAGVREHGQFMFSVFGMIGPLH